MYKPPVVISTSYAATPPLPTPTDLMRGFLSQRNNASAATKGVTLHVWACPDAPFTTPDDVTTPVGMLTQRHAAQAPVATP